jgi:hypothetical protein
MLKPLLKRLNNQQMKRISKSRQGADVERIARCFAHLNLADSNSGNSGSFPYERDQVFVPFEFRHQGQSFAHEEPCGVRRNVLLYGLTVPPSKRCRRRGLVDNSN